MDKYNLLALNLKLFDGGVCGNFRRCGRGRRGYRHSTGWNPGNPRKQPPGKNGRCGKGRVWETGGGGSARRR